MKYPIIILIFLLGCKKEVAINKPDLQSCNFGIEKFNLSKRPLLQDRRAKPTSPPVIVPINTGVILLDFDGAIVTNTSWNYAGDMTLSPANLTSDAIKTITDSVKSKYSLWKVIVTTDEAYYLLADPYRRMRVIFTEYWEWFGQSGGVAFVNSFTWGDNTPCFVFTSLLNYSTKKILEAGTHEAGHTLGLFHQSTFDTSGVKTSDYNYGCCGYAPIMGVAYSQPMSQFIAGYNSYHDWQDDIAKISLLITKK